MNEATVKLVQELADKLGVTAEYLWAALIRQAPISSATELVVDIAIFCAAYWAARRCAAAQKNGADEYLCGLGLMFSAATAIAVAMIVCLRAAIIMSGFSNPEYWALKQIIP